MQNSSVEICWTCANSSKNPVSPFLPDLRVPLGQSQVGSQHKDVGFMQKTSGTDTIPPQNDRKQIMFRGSL